MLSGLAKTLSGFADVTEGMIIMTEIIQKTTVVVKELAAAAKLEPGDLVIIGCSSSEVAGGVIGKHSSPEIGKAIFEAAHSVLSDMGVYVAAQCCEHLNRAVILEKQAAKARGLEIVNVVPVAKAGGSLATAAMQVLENPVAVEYIKADAGIDIGDTLIGMHLKAVAVPFRASVKKIGGANVVCATTRPKYIGGERANYIK